MGSHVAPIRPSYWCPLTLVRAACNVLGWGSPILRLRLIPKPIFFDMVTTHTDHISHLQHVLGLIFLCFISFGYCVIE